MPKDLIHHGGWEHRDVHNINGMFLPKVTSEGLIARGATPKRPFVLTRSFLRWLAAVRRDVDWRQSWHLGAHGRRHQDGPIERDCGHDLWWMSVSLFPSRHLFQVTLTGLRS
jgi:hypothetical protein